MEPVVNNTKRFVNLLSRIDAPVSVEDLMYQLEQLDEKHNILHCKHHEQLFNIDVSIHTIFNLISELKELIDKKNTYSTDIIVSTVEQINYIDDYEFSGEEYEKYLVKLEEYDSYFYLSLRKYSRARAPRIGDVLSHKIEGERIKEWNKVN